MYRAMGGFIRWPCLETWCDLKVRVNQDQDIQYGTHIRVCSKMWRMSSCHQIRHLLEKVIRFLSHVFNSKYPFVKCSQREVIGQAFSLIPWAWLFQENVHQKAVASYSWMPVRGVYLNVINFHAPSRLLYDHANAPGHTSQLLLWVPLACNERQSDSKTLCIQSPATFALGFVRHITPAPRMPWLRWYDYDF